MWTSSPWYVAVEIAVPGTSAPPHAAMPLRGLRALCVACTPGKAPGDHASVIISSAGAAAAAPDCQAVNDA
jgi:hypothetical protein